MVDPWHAMLSITRQCQLVSIARSSYCEGCGESPLNLRLMRLIDEQFLEITRPNHVWYASVTCIPSGCSFGSWESLESDRLIAYGSHVEKAIGAAALQVRLETRNTTSSP